MLIVIFGNVAYKVREPEKDYTEVLKEYNLFQNFPNPSNPETTIRFDLPKSTHVKLEIYNLLGRSVITLTDRRYVQGTYQLLWNGKDNLNHAVSSGVYVYVLKTDTETISRKMILMR